MYDVLTKMFLNKAASKVEIHPATFGTNFRVLIRPMSSWVSQEAYNNVDAELIYGNDGIIRRINYFH